MFLWFLRQSYLSEHTALFNFHANIWLFNFHVNIEVTFCVWYQTYLFVVLRCLWKLKWNPARHTTWPGHVTSAVISADIFLQNLGPRQLPILRWCSSELHSFPPVNDPSGDVCGHQLTPPPDNAMFCDEKNFSFTEITLSMKVDTDIKR